LSYASPLQKKNHIIEKRVGTVDEEIQPRNGCFVIHLPFLGSMIGSFLKIFFLF